MIARVRRTTYNEFIGDANLRKALAFAIFIKERRQCSVIPNWSYRELSRISGLAPGTCKKRLATLRQRKLVREERHGGGAYLVFKKLRCPKLENRRGTGYHSPKGQDVDIRKIDKSSVRAIELGLQSLLIAEVQRRKDYVRQLICSKHQPRSEGEKRSAELACRKRGYEKYTEAGISYKYIARKLGCGFQRISKAIREGERLKIFVKTRQNPIATFVGYNQAAIAFIYMPGFHFATRSNLYVQPANIYTLCGGKEGTI